MQVHVEIHLFGKILPPRSPSACTIDTSRPFSVSHYQDAALSRFAMRQDGQEVAFDLCQGNEAYTERMDEYWRDGMVLVFSLWGEGTLDHALGRY